MDVESFSETIRRQLAATRQSQHRAAVDHNLPQDAVRSVLEGHTPRLDRAAEICRALGLEFYIGPPRDDDTPSADRSSETAPAKTADAGVPAAEAALDPAGFASDVKEAVRDQIAAIMRSEAALIREEVCEGISQHLMTLQEEAISRRRSTDDLEDEGALAVVATGEGEDVPGARRIDIVEYEAAAGGGAEATGEQVVGTLTFRRDWLDRHGLDATQCTVIAVRGESMEPILWEGASILVNRGRTEWRRGRIFVFRTSDGLVVKRAGESEAGERVLVSDNPEHRMTPCPDDAEIIGQVAWTARTLLGA